MNKERKKGTKESMMKEGEIEQKNTQTARYRERKVVVCKVNRFVTQLNTNSQMDLFASGRLKWTHI